MVKKLFKYEIKSYMRIFVPFEIILLATALFTRIVAFFESKSIFYQIVSVSSWVMYFIALAVSLVMVFVVAVTRFYKNMYSYEGYLTFTLPVTSEQHIIVKSLTSLLFVAAAVILAAISALLATAGELCAEILKAGAYLIKETAQNMGTVNLIFYIFEFIVFLLVAELANFLLYYGCISLGQLAKKNRVLMAFVVYLIFYGITQVLGTVVIILVNILPIQTTLEKFFSYAFLHLNTYAHVFLVGGIVISAALSVLYFFINRYVMNKRLNLE